KGGTLKVLPEIALPLLTTSSTGEIDLAFTWPAGVPESTTFYIQYGVQDAGATAGVALSNAMRGVTPGPAMIDEISTTAMNPNDVFTITGVNFGNDPDDICVLMMDDLGAIVGFGRAQSVSGNTATVEVKGIVPGATTAKVAMNVGDGGIVPTSGLPAGLVELNGGSWVFTADPADMFMLDEEIDMFAPVSTDGYLGSNWYQYSFSTQVPGNPGYLEFEMPSGDCPPGTTFQFQLDACSTNGTVYFDYGVALQNTTTLDALSCATIMCQQFQLAVLSQLGILVSCIPVQVGSDVFLRVLPPIGENWKVGSGGYFSICFPAVCNEYYGGIMTNGFIELVMPTTVPDDAVATGYVEGYTDLASYAWAYESVVMPAGPTTPLAVATAIANAMQVEFNTQGVPATAMAVTVGPDVIIQVWPPFLENWDYGWLYLELCELL
ncbi:MAG: hypothetical protein ACI9EF_001868, partial [Pseudohongiellaceae bacterium]